MGSCCCLTQKQGEDHSSAVEELFPYLLELRVSTELQGWPPEDAEGEPESHHWQCCHCKPSCECGRLTSHWASGPNYGTEPYILIYMSGLADGGCGKKPGFKFMEKGWRNYRRPSCLLRFFTLLHCQCIWKPSVNCLLPFTIMWMELW